MAPLPYVFYLPSQNLLPGFADFQQSHLDFDPDLHAVNS